MSNSVTDLRHMHHACQLARQGQGVVEPNPMVGCVVARGEQVLAEGWHQRFGGPHAEVAALGALDKQVSSNEDRAEATLYVTLEPCCHHGKTPPCTDAIISSGIRRVVVAMVDPFPDVAGQGIQRLRDAGMSVDVGIAVAAAEDVLAPYLKLTRSGQPWVLAKWAMTLDGKIATRTRDSQWISSAASRQIVHEIRGRVDAIIIGVGTALADDPLLTARPSGDRIATRIVMDSLARLPLQSRLVQTTDQAPVVVAVGPNADPVAHQSLQNAGVEVLPCAGPTYSDRLTYLLDELGRRRMTNVLVEGGSHVLGSFLDLHAVDEAHVFIAPTLVGGSESVPAIGGIGASSINDALKLRGMLVRQVENDIYVQGRIAQEN